jgi:hypothetical protein
MDGLDELPDVDIVGLADSKSGRRLEGLATINHYTNVLDRLFLELFLSRLLEPLDVAIELRLGTKSSADRLSTR